MPPLSLYFRCRFRLAFRVTVGFTVVREETYVEYQNNKGERVQNLSLTVHDVGKNQVRI